MTPEEIYDSEIAPALKQLSERCSELGFNMVAVVEWEQDRSGYTLSLDTRDDAKFFPGPAMRMAAMAAKAGSNLDKLLMGLIRDCRKYGHSSAYMTILDNDLRKNNV
jgi:hypothetical protein